MSPQELLWKRYKVMGNWPNMPDVIKVGDILVQQDEERKWAFTNGNVFVGLRIIENCPLLFKELQWAEERKHEDLPDYVKLKKSGDIYKRVDVEIPYCHKIWERQGNGSEVVIAIQVNGRRANKGLRYIGCNRLSPATEEQYLYKQILKRNIS